MSEIKYCKKCHERKRTISYQNAQEQLQKIADIDEIAVNCNSMCGPGADQFIAQIDEDIYVEDTFEKLVKEIKENHEN